MADDDGATFKRPALRATPKPLPAGDGDKVAAKKPPAAGGEGGGGDAAGPDPPKAKKPMKPVPVPPKDGAPAPAGDAANPPMAPKPKKPAKAPPAGDGEGPKKEDEAAKPTEPAPAEAKPAAETPAPAPAAAEAKPVETPAPAADASAAKTEPTAKLAEPAAPAAPAPAPSGDAAPAATPATTEAAPAAPAAPAAAAAPADAPPPAAAPTTTADAPAAPAPAPAPETIPPPPVADIPPAPAPTSATSEPAKAEDAPHVDDGPGALDAEGHPTFDVTKRYSEMLAAAREKNSTAPLPPAVRPNADDIFDMARRHGKENREMLGSDVTKEFIFEHVFNEQKHKRKEESQAKREAVDTVLSRHIASNRQRANEPSFSLMAPSANYPSSSYPPRGDPVQFAPPSNPNEPPAFLADLPRPTKRSEYTGHIERMVYQSGSLVDAVAKLMTKVDALLAVSTNMGLTQGELSPSNSFMNRSQSPSRNTSPGWQRIGHVSPPGGGPPGAQVFGAPSPVREPWAAPYGGRTDKFGGVASVFLERGDEQSTVSQTTTGASMYNQFATPGYARPLHSSSATPRSRTSDREAKRTDWDRKARAYFSTDADVELELQNLPTDREIEAELARLSPVPGGGNAAGGQDAINMSEYNMEREIRKIHADLASKRDAYRDSRRVARDASFYDDDPSWAEQSTISGSSYLSLHAKAKERSDPKPLSSATRPGTAPTARNPASRDRSRPKQRREASGDNDDRSSAAEEPPAGWNKTTHIDRASQQGRDDEGDGEEGEADNRPGANFVSAAKPGAPWMKKKWEWSDKLQSRRDSERARRQQEEDERRRAADEEAARMARSNGGAGRRRGDDSNNNSRASTGRQGNNSNSGARAASPPTHEAALWDGATAPHATRESRARDAPPKRLGAGEVVGRPVSPVRGSRSQPPGFNHPHGQGNTQTREAYDDRRSPDQAPPPASTGRSEGSASTRPRANPLGGASDAGSQGGTRPKIVHRRGQTPTRDRTGSGSTAARDNMADVALGAEEDLEDDRADERRPASRGSTMSSQTYPKSILKKSGELPGVGENSRGEERERDARAKSPTKGGRNATMLNARDRMSSPEQRTRTGSNTNPSGSDAPKTPTGGDVSRIPYPASATRTSDREARGASASRDGDRESAGGRSRAGTSDASSAAASGGGGGGGTKFVDARHRSRAAHEARAAQEEEEAAAARAAAAEEEELARREAIRREREELEAERQQLLAEREQQRADAEAERVAFMMELMAETQRMMAEGVPATTTTTTTAAAANTSTGGARSRETSGATPPTRDVARISDARPPPGPTGARASAAATAPPVDDDEASNPEMAALDAAAPAPSAGVRSTTRFTAGGGNNNPSASSNNPLGTSTPGGVLRSGSAGGTARMPVEPLTAAPGYRTPSEVDLDDDQLSFFDESIEGPLPARGAKSAARGSKKPAAKKRAAAQQPEPNLPPSAYPARTPKAVAARASPDDGDEAVVIVASDGAAVTIPKAQARQCGALVSGMTFVRLSDVDGRTLEVVAEFMTKPDMNLDRFLSVGIPNLLIAAERLRAPSLALFVLSHVLVEGLLSEEELVNRMSHSWISSFDAQKVEQLRAKFQDASNGRLFDLLLEATEKNRRRFTQRRNAGQTPLDEIPFYEMADIVTEMDAYSFKWARTLRSYSRTAPRDPFAQPHMPESSSKRYMKYPLRRT